MDQGIYQLDSQVVVGSKYISRNSRREVATKLFLVRTGGGVSNKSTIKFGDKRTDFAHQPFF